MKGIHETSEGTKAGEKTSRIPNFYKLTPQQRVARVQEFTGLSDEDVSPLLGSTGLSLDSADKMIENVGGLFSFPFGFAPNFKVDGKDRIIPMVVEEPSVVAAASNAARLLREGEGIATRATAPIMIGQIQLCDVQNFEMAISRLEEAKLDLLCKANASQPRLISRGGGAQDMDFRAFPKTDAGPMLIVHLLVDVQNAMGANIVNSMVETIASDCEALTGGVACMKILSNLADRRLVTAVGRVPFALLERPQLSMTGDEVADRLVKASVFAEIDPYRATTHNKGTMNGVDAFMLATGQDWRAVEAGAHAFAAASGRYRALATWRIDDEELVGELTLPMQVGTVGGVTKVHPVVQTALKVVNADDATELGRIATAVGLAQNLAAILALTTEGIQRGHMSLHARNIAASVGATGPMIDQIATKMVTKKLINHDYAALLFQKMAS